MVWMKIQLTFPSKERKRKISPRLTWRLSNMRGSTSILISHFFKRSPSISSLVLFSSTNFPNGNGLAISTCFTLLPPARGEFSDSSTRIFLSLSLFFFSGAFPAHGHGMVGGANGKKASSRIVNGLTLQVLE